MEDALLSSESFAILSGAGLIAAADSKPIYVHMTAQVQAIAENTLKIEDLACWNGGRVAGNNSVPDEYKHQEADIFCMKLDDNGEVAVEPCVPADVKHQSDGSTLITCVAGAEVVEGDIVLVDYYVKKTGKAQMIEITADKFGGNYYLEASTLFRRESDGVDMPAEFVIPNCKIQSNFTFSMASSGDPSTFTFTIDAFPDYVKFDRTHKVLAAIQIIEDDDDLGDEEYRQACEATPFNFNITSKDANVQLAFINDGNVVIGGKNISGNSYDSDVFGTEARGTQINMKLPTSGTGDYKIVQTNPGLSAYYSDDINVIGNKKTKEYTESELNEGYGFLATDQPGDIKIEFFKNGTLVKTYNFKNEVIFA